MGKRRYGVPLLSIFMNYTTKLTHYVDVYDLCQEVVSAYPDLTSPNGFELLECGNDTEYTVEIKAPKPLDEYDQKTLEKGLRSGGLEHYYLHIIMQELVNKECIPPGAYVVRVSW